MTALVLVEAAVLIVLSVLVVGLLRSYGDVLRRLHRLEGGQSPSETRSPSRPQSPSQPLPVPDFRTSAEVIPPSDNTNPGWPAGHTSPAPA
jgi:hypothetical protein